MTARRILMALAVALTIQCSIAVRPAHADHDRHGRHHEHHGRGWHHGWHHRYRVYSYAPPPEVYYAPPPVYVPPPPPPSVGFNLIIPFRFH